MKILHLASEYPPQKVFGLGRFVHDLAAEQAGRAHEVHVVTNSIGDRDREVMDRGVHVHRVDAPPPPKPSDSPAMVTQFNTQILERVFRDDICPDAGAVNAHDWLTFLAARAIARRTGSLLVMFFHDVVVGKRFGELDNEAKYVGNVEHWACHEADRVICVSQHVRDEVMETYGASSEKTFAIHNAVSEDNFPEPDGRLLARFRRVFATDEEQIVLYVGRLDAEKGVDVLLRAFRRVVAAPLGAKLVIAGKGERRSDLETLAAELGVRDRVVFAGYVAGPVLTYLYHAADILAVPSLYEPFGIVALEGMICGLPVVASDTGGLSEVVQDRRSGRLVPAGKPAALAEALTEMLNGPDIRRRMGERGRARAREVFTWSAVAGQIDGIVAGRQEGGEAHRERLLIVVNTHRPDFPLLEENRAAFESLARQGHAVRFLCDPGDAEALTARWAGVAEAVEVDAPPGHEHLMSKVSAGYAALPLRDFDWLVKIDSDTLIVGDLPGYVAEQSGCDAFGAPSHFEPVLHAIEVAGPPTVPPDVLRRIGNRYLRGFFYGIRSAALVRALPLMAEMAPRMRVEDATTTACLVATQARVHFCDDLSSDLSPDATELAPSSPVAHFESREPEERERFHGQIRAGPHVTAAPANRVLFDLQHLSRPMTGVDYYAKHVLHEMLSRDIRHRWFLLGHPGNAGAVRDIAQPFPNAEAVILPHPVPLDPRHQGPILSQVIGRHRVDIYFSPFFMSAPRTVCPTVSVIHDAAYAVHPDFFPAGVADHLRRCVDATCRDAARLITVSENSRREVARVHGFPMERITAVHLAPDPGLFDESSPADLRRLRARYGVPPEYLLAVNMWNPKKNAPMLLRAYARIPPETRARRALVVAGENKPEILDIEELAAGLGVGEEVVLTGYLPREDLCLLYAGALIFCFPSLHEGFGLPALEAMAAGVPVVSSHAASLPEVVGNAGVLLHPEDEAAWTETLAELLHSEDRRRQLSAAGRARAATFSWERTARETLDVIEETLTERDVARSGRVATAARGRPGCRTILMVSRQIDPPTGGAERSSAALLTRLADRGYACHAVCRSPVAPARIPGVTVHPVHDAGGAAEVAAGLHPDIIFSQLHWTPLAADLAGELGIPHVVLIRSMEPFCPDPIRYMRCRRDCSRCPAFNALRPRLNAQQAALRGADAVIANSEFMRRVVAEFTDVDARVVYPVIDFEAVRAGPGPRDRVLMCSPMPHKGGPLFCEVARRMTETPFLCVGLGAGPDLPNVVNWGRSDPAAFYAHARLLMVPSAGPEAFGRVVPEAMSNGIPVVASNVGGLPEAVGRGGLLLDNYTDPCSWIQAIRRVLQGDAYEALVRAGVSTVAQFQPEVQVGKAINVLENVCEAAAGRAGSR